MECARAAGGLMWRDTDGRVALVHRRRQGDWSLPKGKLDSDEAWHRAALREVAEETGCAARITRFAGAKLFLDRTTPKLVLYWHMRVLREGPLEHEVDEVAWLTPRAALARLDHPSDRRLLLRALPAGPWRSGGHPEQPDPLDPEALRRLLVVDTRASVDTLDPWIRQVEKAVARARRGSLRAVSAAER
jgi:8-oxo-dGTP pyrophosphatase MutT (NUDIX family)